jgi:hypothetical protein
MEGWRGEESKVWGVKEDRCKRKEGKIGRGVVLA